MKVAIIPARFGSKRIRNKNLREFQGKPLFLHSVSAAVESEIFDKIIVSSDSDEILAIAKSQGVAGLSRSPELSNDTSIITEVVNSIILSELIKSTDLVCCLLPSNPFIESQTLINALNYVDHWDFVFPIVRGSDPIQRALSRDSNGLTRMRDNHFTLTRSQDLDAYYFDSGQFYFGYANKWSSNQPILGSRSYGMILDRKDSVDIDTEFDWELANFLFAKRTFNNNLRTNIDLNKEVGI